MKIRIFKIFISLCCLFTVTPLFAADEGTASSSGAENKWLVSGHFSYFDLMLPGKIGFAVARAASPTTAWELEYTHGSFTPFFIDDLGKFSEDRITFVERSGNRSFDGFQWYYGVFYQRFKLEIGNALLSRLSGVYPSADVVSISGLGGVIGLGYRWLVSESFVIGVDAAYSQPIYTLTRDTKFLEVVTDTNDRQKIEAGVTAMEYFPRFAIAKLMLGYSF